MFSGLGQAFQGKDKCFEPSYRTSVFRVMTSVFMVRTSVDR